MPGTIGMVYFDRKRLRLAGFLIQEVLIEASFALHRKFAWGRDRFPALLTVSSTSATVLTFEQYIFGRLSLDQVVPKTPLLVGICSVLLHTLVRSQRSSRYYVTRSTPIYSPWGWACSFFFIIADHFSQTRSLDGLHSSPQ